MGTTNRPQGPTIRNILRCSWRTSWWKGRRGWSLCTGSMARRAARSAASVTTWSTWYTHAIRSSALARPVRIRSPAARQARRMSARQAPASLAVSNLATTDPSRRSLSRSRWMTGVLGAHATKPRLSSCLDAMRKLARLKRAGSVRSALQQPSRKVRSTSAPISLSLCTQLQHRSLRTAAYEQR